MTRQWPTIPGLLHQQRKYFAALGGKLHINPASAFEFFKSFEHDREDHWTIDIGIVGEKADRHFEGGRGSESLKP